MGRGGVDLKPLSILDSNSCGVLASKRLVLAVSACYPAGWGKERKGLQRLKSVSAQTFLRPSGPGEKTSDSREGDFTAPLRTSAASHPIQMPHPHCKSSEGSAPASRAQPLRPSSSSPVYSTPTFPASRTPRFPARKSVPSEGPGRAERGPNWGPRGSEKRGERGLPRQERKERDLGEREPALAPTLRVPFGGSDHGLTSW